MSHYRMNITLNNVLVFYKYKLRLYIGPDSLRMYSASRTLKVGTQLNTEI